MKANFYQIEAITNMHVGSGDANYGVIDNLIQRDVVTNLPTINGSSLKGALRQFFEHHWGEKDSRLINIFGDDNKDADYRFLSANLMVLPVRSNKKAYFLATAPMVIENLKKDKKIFGGEIELSVFDNFLPKDGIPIVFTEKADLLIEDFEDFQQNEKPAEKSIFGDFENLVILSDKDFKRLTSDIHLPVIARNKVGASLWYEQVVPHKSLFSFVLLYNDSNSINDFEGEFKKDFVHIGANATVGYGFSKISKLN